MKFYVLEICGGEIQSIGPFSTSEERNAHAKKVWADMDLMEGDNVFWSEGDDVFWSDVDDNGSMTVGPFLEGDLE
jgi:hypothetical protein